MLDRYAFLERLVGVALERHDLATTVATVCGDEHFALCVVDPIAQRLRRESAEDDGMNRADASTGEHRDRCFGDERHVNGHAIAALDAELLENVGELLHLDVEIPVRQRAVIARLAFPDNRRLVPSG